MSSTSVTFELRGDLMQPGFKTLIWELAVKAGLGGWVTDSQDGTYVLLRLDGDEEEIRRFIRPIPGKLLPAYPLKNICVADHAQFDDTPLIRDFKVFPSNKFKVPELAPDKMFCPDCLAEIMDPASPRYAYPFSFCSKCGPRYSMLMRAPGVRRNTTYAAFPACRDCRDQKNNKKDKLHYQSEMLACPNCGPHLFLLDDEGEQADDEHCICYARADLNMGRLLAVQSLFGGFQLFVDAKNPIAITKLRKRKKLTSRPIAIVARNIEAVKKICNCSPQEEALLKSSAAPIVILDAKPGAEEILPLDLLNQDGPRIGVALPCSSTLHLLMSHVSPDDTNPPIDYLATVTSNWVDKSSATDIDEQIHALRGIADVFLCHDLRTGTCNPASVAVIRDGAPQIWRRSRGYVPTPVKLARRLRRNVIAFGTDINTSVAIAAEDRIIPSQFMGDILNMDAAARLTTALKHFMTVFDCVPDVVACDMNPRLLSAEEALRFANQFNLPLVTVQTHHAKALAGMAENGLERALAFVFDNGEPGPDGVNWGAELLDVDVRSFRRLGTFQAVGLPGRENALSRPVRQFIGRLIQAGVEITPAMRDHFHVSEEEIAIWQKNCAGQGRYLMTHAAARLFDSVSAGLGIAADFIGYRGQSAARLEYAAMRAVGGLNAIPAWMYDKFSFNVYEDDTPKLVVDWSPLFRNFADLSWVKPENIPQLSLAFHAKIADSVASLAHYGASKTGTRDILLSGSIFMNGILLELVLGKLRSENYNVYIHRNVPMDGSGICVGQAFNAAY